MNNPCFLFAMNNKDESKCEEFLLLYYSITNKYVLEWLDRMVVKPMT